MAKLKTLLDEYRFRGFRPRAPVKGIFGDPKARIVRLERTGKKRFAGLVERYIGVSMIERAVEFAIFRAAMPACTWTLRFAG